MAGPAPTTLSSHEDRTAGPVHSSGWLFVCRRAAFLLEPPENRLPRIDGVDRPTKSHQVDSAVNVTARLRERTLTFHVPLAGSLPDLTDLVLLVGHGEPPQTNNVMPISGRAGAAPTFESPEGYPPARSTALAGYATPSRDQSRTSVEVRSHRSCNSSAPSS
jgi:hypothetical protein